MPTTEELWNLLGQIEDMPYGLSRTAACEQLLRHVDGAGDQRLAFVSRLIATNSFGYGGEPAKAFVTFSWCLGDVDKNPQPYHQRSLPSLLWVYKAIVGALTAFPEVPLARTYAVLDDMERRYREYGQGMQALYKYRYVVADHVGLVDDADAWFARWQSAPRDSLSDCVGCDPSDVAEYLSARGRFEDAVRHADPVLEGKLTCIEQPQRILGELMVPYVMTGSEAAASDAHRRSYRLERDNVADMSSIADHIEFCARTGNEHRGLEILQRHLDWLDRAPSPAAEMNLLAAGGLLLRRLTEIGHGDAVIRRRDRPDATAADTATELRARAVALSRRFDERNGTDRQSRRIAARLDAEPYPTRLVLSPTARAVTTTVPAPPIAEPAAAAEIPAEARADDLIERAEQHVLDDRADDLAAVLDILDARFPVLDDPLLAARRALLAGERLRTADVETMLTRWQEAADLFATTGDQGKVSMIRARMALARARSGPYSGERDAIDADIAYQDEHGDARERAQAWRRLSLLHHQRGRHAEANEIGDRSDVHAAESGDERLIAMNALLRGRGRMAINAPEEAAAAAAQAYEFFRIHGPSLRVAESASMLAYLIDDPAQEFDLFSAVIATALPEHALPARVGRGGALMRQDRAAEAIVDLVEAVAICAERGLEGEGGFARAELAGAYRRAGRPVEGAEVAEEAVAIFDRLGDQESADNARYLLAALYRELEDANGALALYRELLERQEDNPHGRGQIAEEAADLLFHMDRDAEAAEAFAAAASALSEADDPIGELRALRRRIAALHYADEPDEAERVVKFAVERFDALPPELAGESNAIFQRSLVGYEAANMLMARERYAEAIPHLRGVAGKLRAIGATEQAERVESMLAEAEARASMS